MQKTTVTEAALTPDDLHELSTTRRTMRKVFFIFFPLNVVLAMAAGLIFQFVWLGLVFAVFALVTGLLFWYSEKRFKSDTAQHIKYIVTGPVEPLITIPGGKVRATIDRANQRLITRVVKGASEKQYDEPFVLPPGQTDHFRYALRIGSTSVMVDRAVFLDFQPGEHGRLEVTPAGTLIRYAKTRK